ncbi:hypothetical protein [Herbaspirillum rubrisubalbicans]|uniref:hypothetical protein n=1 Tax=Herbaspirillum rubrisubalbicans TaxID=80842 RepID=UPI0018D1FA97|nr:hypothetical protein [Herbaspirillum rubrisubalbicans]
MHEDIDPSVAMRKLNQLQLEEGDLGAAYCLSISELPKASGEYRDRAIAAERRLQEIRRLCDWTNMMNRQAHKKRLYKRQWQAKHP